jgi:hypothetical protein
MTTFDDQLALSDPGDEIVYHEGFHCVDLDGRRIPEAKEAWLAYVRGDVLLYQRRLGVDRLQYCARVIR